MTNALLNVLNRFRGGAGNDGDHNYPRDRSSSLGFHGDQYLLNLIDPVLDSSDVFVETGTNYGRTLRYVRDRYRNLKCYSCEPREEAFEAAKRNVLPSDRVEIQNVTSEEFLPAVTEEIENQNVFLFADAHGDGFDWPLRFEINHATTHLSRLAILIDDCLVPGRPRFGYDEYENQVCSVEYVLDQLASDREYVVIYPAYRVRTSTHHPLRGYALVLVDMEMSAIPGQILENFEVNRLDPDSGRLHEHEGPGVDLQRA